MQALTTCPRETVSWFNVNVVPVQEGESLSSGDWEDVLLSGIVPEIELLRLRDPNAFVPGGIHANPTAWEVILSGYPAKERLLNWIRNKVDIFEFRNTAGTCLPPNASPTMFLVTNLRTLSVRKF